MPIMDTMTIKRIAVVIGLVAIVIIAVVGIVRLATGGDDSPIGDATQVELLDYNNDSSSVRLTYEGEIVAREDYRELRFTVSPTLRRLEVIRGYNGQVIERKTYRNDQAAYSVFLKALNFEGFDQSRSSPLGDDHEGTCPRGNRTIVELFSEGTRELKLWSASCDRDLGTLDAQERDLRRLFEAQIPDFRDLTRGVRL